ncbi:hypothetical protein AJ79_08122 [Helicocarpus griseus UAMH5409]|uniref:L-tyrosine decarboxylase C-terminal domain-containing protein n=1 Tax=Helicocarpus griseus UAMH5409 TaxID=1447875 RepID=A0A2B7WW24_9EURO|nr:hypothetical protein AJ79_08122 [Helicocarpus griseus UAMH5409]
MAKGNTTTTSSTEDKTHQAISSYFIGPQAENLPFFQRNIDTILRELGQARQAYFPEDGRFITKKIQDSKEYIKNTTQISAAVKMAAKLLGKHSIPCWNPRYEGHMATDINIPGLLGYFMTMLYNPNNVTLEASPLTTIAEMEVGEQLCDLFGYNTDPERKDMPLAWGHITCGGTVANLESIWVARNLKFYPLALRRAVEEGSLQFVADTFKVQTCVGEEKLFIDLSTWELLNLRSKTILDLSQSLYDQYGISSTYVEKAVEPYNPQSIGKDDLERHFKLDKPIQYFLSKTRHYSWPKGAAVAGIGSANAVGLEVDNGARVDLKDLESKLEACLKNQQAVYAVVAIVGSTEEGAVDPLGRILAIRQRFQARGLSFLVHADAAWGGYFATMLPKDLSNDLMEPGLVGPHVGAGLNTDDEGFVPDLSLKAETQEDLFALRYADSITVDPHKAGYAPYPAGALAYRDGRMRYLVTWTTPYLSRGADTSIGIYGLEGSKPGAAAMSVYLSNKCIGLNPEGYGALHSEVSFTCTRLSAYWAAMTTKYDSFVCVPFNMLPSELSGGDETAIETERQRIRDEIISKSNREIVAADEGKPHEQRTMTLLRQLGSDLNINTFALNWRYEDGTLNDDVEEANYLMQRVIERVSVDSPDDIPTEIPFYLTSTEFTHELYGKCAQTFKKRLHLKDNEKAPHSLFVLRNVVMSPFPTQNTFFDKLMKDFKKVVEEEVKVCRERNSSGPAVHNFLIQGTDKVFLVYQPSFHLAKHRRQAILAAELPKEDMDVYRQVKNTSAEDPIFLRTVKEVNIHDLLDKVKSGTQVQIRGTVYNSNGLIQSSVPVTITRIIKDRPLASIYRDSAYPSAYMPFYIYGDSKQQHISHMLLKAPNIGLCAGNVTLQLNDGQILNDTDLSRGAILCLTKVPEAARQPFPAKNADIPRGFFFRAGEKFPIKIYSDPHDASTGGPGLLDGLTEVLADGTMTLGRDLQVDAESVNRDIFKRVDKVSRWRDEFGKIGKELK